MLQNHDTYRLAIQIKSTPRYRENIILSRPRSFPSPLTLISLFLIYSFKHPDFIIHIKWSLSLCLSGPDVFDIEKF